MLRDLKELYFLLTKEQQKNLLRLQLLVVVMSITEVASVLGIGPFMTLVSDIDALGGQNILAQLFAASGVGSPEVFIFIFGIAVLILLFFSTVISMLTIWRLHLYGAHVGAELASRLYDFYMHKPWLFHSASSTSELTKQISQECQRTSINIIKPLMQLNAKLIMALFMIAAMFIYSFKIMFAGVFIFITSYIVLYKFVRSKLNENGKMVSSAQEKRYKLLNEGFGGIKDVLLLNRQLNFMQNFNKSSHQYFQALGTTQGLSQVPRYAMEFIAYGSIIFLVLYLLSINNEGIGSVVPVLSVFALAGFKLLPAFQQIYSNLALIRGNLAAFKSIRVDLKETLILDDSKNNNSIASDDKILSVSFAKSIKFRNIKFQYTGKKVAALNNLNFEIPANKVIGLVGSSGSGKSTIIDLLLGLIEPDEGEIIIDGTPLNKKINRSWQKIIGFVPQSIFLSDATIRNNIAFGLSENEIDEQRIKRAIKLAHLDELIASLPEGLNTTVGERGVQLSGGQRQRIGIARALYEKTEVLILDEATSALDGISEKIVMDAIHDFSGKKTVIMIAHRLNTVKKCDRIYLIEKGSVIDSGSFNELLSRNKTFKNMSVLA